MQKLRKLFFLSLFFLCLFLKPMSIPVTNMQSGTAVPIIMYHKISTRAAALGKYTISPEEFERDIKLILARGFTPINVGDLETYVNSGTPLPEKPIILTFDDGHRSDYVYAFPLAKKYNVKIVCSPVAAYVEEYSKSEDHNVNYAYLTWDEMAEMEKSGLVEFQNHSFNLHNFSKSRKGCLKSDGESPRDYATLILSDLRLAQELFAKNNLKVPTCFTYPYGMRDEELLVLVKEAGFTSTLGTYARVNIMGGDLYDLCRFNRPHNYNIDKILDAAE